ncbi:MAG: RNA methyltransferase, partial [Eggerthella lenta]
MIENVETLDDPRLDAFARLTEAQLRSKLEPEKALFIAESGTVIERALAAGMEPL